MTMLEPAQDRRIRDSIGRQTLLETLGIRIAELCPGRVTLELPFRPDLCQQNGFIHAGAITTTADSACGYAAMTLQPAGSDILTAHLAARPQPPRSLCPVPRRTSHR